MLLGDWLILIGVTLITVGVTGLTLLEMRRGSGESDLARSDPDLTDVVCRLADGSMGRVAIIPGSDEEWTAVCVRA